MIPNLLALAWGLLVVLLAASRRPPPARLRAIRPMPTSMRTASSPSARVGALLRRVVRRPGNPSADQRVGRAAAAGVVGTLVLGLPVGVAIGVGCWTLPWWRDRRRAHRGASATRDELPDAIELLLLGVDAGLTPRLAVEAVAAHLPGPTGSAFSAVIERIEVGVRLADALDVLVERLGEPLRPIVAVLADADRYGTPLRAGLERVAAEARDDRRRRAEAAARTVPVKLLFPLVCCTLPAFALVTVVPLLAGSLDALSF